MRCINSFTRALILIIWLSSCHTSYPAFDLNTSAGRMTIRLYQDTPDQNAAFLEYCRQGLFDQVLWTRVVQDILIECQAQKRIQTSLKNTPTAHLPLSGAVAIMEDEQHVAGPRLFIIHGKKWTKPEIETWARQQHIVLTEQEMQLYVQSGGAPQLHNKVAVFGKVEHGLEVIDRIASVPHDANDSPLLPVYLNSIRIMSPEQSR